MPSNYTPIATKHATVTRPSGGDSRNVLSVNTPIEELADRTEYALSVAMRCMQKRHAVANHQSVTITIGATSPKMASSGGNIFVGHAQAVQTSSNYGASWSSQTISTFSVPEILSALLVRSLSNAYVITSADNTRGRISVGNSLASMSTAYDDLSSGALLALCNGPSDTVVAVGNLGHIVTMPSSAASGTKRTPASAFAGSFYGCAASATNIAVCGASGTLQTSANGGTTFVSRTAPASYSGTYYSMVHANAVGRNIFVVVGSGSALHYSIDDGATWQAGSTAPWGFGTGITFRSVIYTGGAVNPGIFLASGSAGALFASEDGINWVRVGHDVYTEDLYSACSVGSTDGAALIVLGGYNGSAGIVRKSQFIAP